MHQGNHLDSATGEEIRLGRLVEVHAAELKEIECIEAGDIVAVQGAKGIRTGDTLCDPAKPCTLERMVFPAPVLSVRIEAARASELDEVGKALGHLVREDPSLSMSIDRETGDTLLHGMGELHLEVKCNRLRNDFGLEVRTGSPRVAYRETVSRSVEHTNRLKKQGGGPGMFAEVTIRIEPLPRGSDFEFYSKITGGKVPAEYVSGVERGIIAASKEGPIAGFEVVDFKATLLDGLTHSNDSSALAFELCARDAFREAAKLAGPELLEPIMVVEVITPEEYLGACVGDLLRRRGQITAQEIRRSERCLSAHVPLGEMFGYIGALRSLSAGRARYSMEFAHYGAASHELASTLSRG